MTDTVMLYAQNSCTQNNIVATNYQLRNSSGQPFSVTDDYELGDPVIGELWVTLSNNTGGGYNLRMFYDRYSNGTLVAASQQDCLFPGTSIQANTWVKVRAITWNWGDVIEIKNIFIDWTTGTPKSGTTCNFNLSQDPQKTSQCYSNQTGFTAAVPLFPKFDFASNGICNTNIQFTSQTIGGTPPYSYSYSWDFNNDNIADSNLANPTYNFPSTGTYPINLTVFDGTSTTKITKDIFIDPNFGITVDIWPTKKNDDSGIIYVQNVTGGTPPYSFFWTGPNGFTSTDKDIFNLTDGLYHLTVTDANGCQQTEQYTMDIATVLNLDWNSVEITAKSDRIKVTWEMSSEIIGTEYNVQRSAGGNLNFKSIATFKSQNTSFTSVKYEFEDKNYPRLKEHLYYRIEKKTSGRSDFSPIKMIQLENQIPGNSWLVFPNPSSNGNFNIYLKNPNSSKEELVTIDVFDAGNFFKKERLPIKSGDTIKLQELIGTLPKGIFFLKIQSGTSVEVFKLINGY